MVPEENLRARYTEYKGSHENLEPRAVRKTVSEVKSVSYLKVVLSAIRIKGLAKPTHPGPFLPFPVLSLNAPQGLAWGVTGSYIVAMVGRQVKASYTPFQALKCFQCTWCTLASFSCEFTDLCSAGIFSTSSSRVAQLNRKIRVGFMCKS